MADVTDAPTDPTDTAPLSAGPGSDASASGAATAGPMNPDQLAELEEERRFLLQSIADLDRELAAGDVDRADYESLRDGYTSRAAAVLRSIDAGRAALATRSPRKPWRIVAITTAVLLFGAGLGVLVARFATPRGSGDTITGGTDDDRIAALLSDARAALNTSNSDLARAVEDYKQVLEIDSDNAEARTYLGWVVALTSQNLAVDARASTIAEGKNLLLQVIEADPSYADPYCFLAVIAAELEADVQTATARRDECLSHDPSSHMQLLIAQFVEPVTASAPSN